MNHSPDLRRRERSGMSPLLLAQMTTQVPWDLRHRSPVKIGQGTLFGEMTKLVMQEKRQDTLHRQAMSGRARTSGPPKRWSYHFVRVIRSMIRKSGHPGKNGRWKRAPAMISTANLSATIMRSTGSPHRVHRVGGTIVVRQMVTKTGAVIVRKARRMIIGNGLVDGLRTHA